jgi:predicted flap endonuclease-1-like 5' DNA nuclease
MSLFTDPSPPAMPKLTVEERRAREADRLATIRLRMLISRELDGRGITTPAAIAEVLDMPTAEVTKMLTGRRWREGDVPLLEAAAAQLGLQAPG